MPKPILSIGISFPPPMKMMVEMQQMYDQKYTDYHVLIWVSNEQYNKVEVFHAKDFKEIEFKELKEQVLKSLEEIH